jgi:hypothetical protein
MAGHSAWAGGLLGGSNGAFIPAFAASDLAGLAYQAAVMSTITFDNTVATLGTPDQFMDISLVGAITTSGIIPTGAGLGLWMYILQADNATWGGGRLAATGAQLAGFGPIMNSLGGIPIEPGSGVTAISGSSLMISIPPRVFRLVTQNQIASGAGFALAPGSGNMISIATYRQATNA